MKIPSATDLLPGGPLIFTIGLALATVGSLVGEAGLEAPSIQPLEVNVLMGEVADRSLTPFDVKLTNIGSRPAKIVGAPSVCGRRGCVTAFELPTTVPPHQSVTIRYLYQANMTGPVELMSSIYFDIGEKQGVAVPVAFRGSVVGPASTP